MQGDIWKKGGHRHKKKKKNATSHDERRPTVVWTYACWKKEKKERIRITADNDL